MASQELPDSNCDERLCLEFQERCLGYFQLHGRRPPLDIIDVFLPPPESAKYLSTLLDNVLTHLQASWDAFDRERRAPGAPGSPTLIYPHAVEQYVSRFPILGDVDIVARLESRWAELQTQIEAKRSAPEIRDFDLLGEIGRGGMGVVYKARQISLDRMVAIKVISSDLAENAKVRERFMREARSAADVGVHDNIVTIHQFGVDPVLHIVMSFVDGESVADWLDRGERPSQAEILRIGRETAEGLAAAHRAGWIHRDIKPANLRLESPTGRVRIVDFGLSRPVMDTADLTSPGEFVGTPGFAAPEQVLGHRVDERCDLYSLGVVLYRLLTAKMPVWNPELQSPSAKDPSIHPDLSKLVVTLLAKDPSARLQSAHEVAHVLRLIAAGQKPIWPTPKAPGVSPSQHPGSTRRGFLGCVAKLGIGGLLGGGAILHYLNTLRAPTGNDIRNPGPLFDILSAGPTRIVPGARNQLRVSDGGTLDMSPYVRAACGAIEGICASRPHVSIPVAFDDPRIAAGFQTDAHLICVGGPVSNEMFADLNGYVYRKVVRKGREIDFPSWQGSGGMRYAFFVGTDAFGDWDGNPRVAWRYDEFGILKPHHYFALMDGQTRIEPELSNDENPLLLCDYLIITRRPHPLYPERRATSIGGMHGYSLEAFADSLHDALSVINSEIERWHFDCFQMVIPARLEHHHGEVRRTVATLLLDEIDRFSPVALSRRPGDWT